MSQPTRGALPALLAALRGRCPACGAASFTEGVLVVREHCSACGVRFERYVGARMIATPLCFVLAGALAFQIGPIVQAGRASTGQLLGGLALVVGLSYPVVRNLVVFLLWQNGLVTHDSPEPERPRRRSSPISLDESPARPAEDERPDRRGR